MPNQNFIDGALGRRPVAARTDDVVNPATGEVLAEVPASDGADVDDAVAAAKAAFDGWRTLTPEGAQRGPVRGRRRDRGRPGHHQAARDGELRQAGRR